MPFLLMRHPRHASRTTRIEAVESTCQVCGRLFLVPAYKVRAGKGKTCSVQCRCLKASRMAPPTPSGPTVRSGQATVNGRKCRESIAATNLLNREVRAGRLARPDACVECGRATAVQGHHEDYSRPLDVVWLCRSCHVKRHVAMGRAGIRPKGLS